MGLLYTVCADTNSTESESNIRSIAYKYMTWKAQHCYAVCSLPPLRKRKAAALGVDEDLGTWDEKGLFVLTCSLVFLKLEVPNDPSTSNVLE